MFGDYENFIDMINGGGAGRAGQRFEGGGLLSMIANEVARPYGYRERLSQARPVARPPMQPMPAPTPAPMPRPNPMASGMTPANAYVAPQQYSTSGMNPANAYVPNRPMQYSGRGVVGMPMPPFARTPEEQATIEYLRSIGAIDY